MVALLAVRRWAVVTGAGVGIGRAIAIRLAAEGTAVLLVGRGEPALASVRADIRAAGCDAACLAIDITSPGASDKIVSEAVKVMGGLDILVNCASATHNSDFFDLTDEQWLRGFEVKVHASIRLSRTAWPILRESAGSLVNICGVGARTPRADNAMTAALSGSLIAITKALAERGIVEGVQVNAVNPGITRTPRIQSRFEGDAGDAALDKLVRCAGATRIGEPEDIANLVAYIVSPAGSFLQGATIDIDGGLTRGI